MSKMKRNQAFTRKTTLIGLLTALTAVLSYIKIPVASAATVTLVLPVVVIGAIICGPIVGAWLTVIPALTAIPEAALFMTYAPFGTLLTLLLKGLLAGYAAGAVYKLLSDKHPTGAVFASAAIAPVINSGVFVLGCYIFIWPELISLAEANGIGVGLFLMGLAGVNFIIEIILNIVLCPSLLRIIEIAKKKNLFKLK